jgi:pimeloyl-ACP methyl ester carboxylesterase
MNPIKLFFFLLFFTSTGLLQSCHKEEVKPKGDDSNQVCDKSWFPLVLVHGFLASGDTYEKQALRFASNSVCEDRIFTFDWNTLGGQNNEQRLKSFIEDVLSSTGADKVFLAGHSAGSNLCYEVLSDPGYAQKVAAYAHLAGNGRPGPAGPEGSVKTLNLYSTADPIVAGSDIPGAKNIRFTDLDHYEVATSEASFLELFSFFFGQEPKQTTVLASSTETILIAGKSLSLGENVPEVGARIEVYETNPSTGERLSATPLHTSIVDEQGNWGPFEAKKDQTYEFFLQPVRDSRPIHYYRRGFVRDNALVYLRSLPPAGSAAGLLLSGLPRDDNQSVVAIFTANQAVIHGRDELYCNEFELSKPNLAPASASNIAWFLYDANNNGASDGTGIFTFSLLPFLTGVDLYFPADQRRSFVASFQGDALYFTNWKSDSEGLIVLVFD